MPMIVDVKPNRIELTNNGSGLLPRKDKKNSTPASLGPKPATATGIAAAKKIPGIKKNNNIKSIFIPTENRQNQNPIPKKI